jgi:hypothetical protein
MFLVWRGRFRVEFRDRVVVPAVSSIALLPTKKPR